jgi:cell division protein FtsB
MTGPAQRPVEPRPAGSGPARSRTHFTGRAAVLAIVLCGIALSLAYPVREYISQRKQIDQLTAANHRINAEKEHLQAEYRMLHSPVFVEAQARDRLHMCLPNQTCYEIIGSASTKPKVVAEKVTTVPWYARMWSSVQVANNRPVSTSGPGVKGHGHSKAKASAGRDGAHRTGQQHRNGGAHRG